MKTFTKEDALAIQENDLRAWSTLLRPDIYQWLRQRVQRDNDKVYDPNDICRGDAITDLVKFYIRNYL